MPLHALPPAITAFEDPHAERQYVVFIDQCGDLQLLASGPAAIWTESRLFPAGVYAPGSPLVGRYEPRAKGSHLLFLAGDAEPQPGDLVDASGTPPWASLVDITAATALESPSAVPRSFEACGETLGGFEPHDDAPVYPTLVYALPTMPRTRVTFHVGADRGISVSFGGSVTRLTQPGQTLPSARGAHVLAGYYDLFTDGLVLYYVGDDAFIYEYRRLLTAPSSWTWQLVGGGTAAH